MVSGELRLSTITFDQYGVIVQHNPDIDFWQTIVIVLDNSLSRNNCIPIFICLNSSHTPSSWIKIAKYILKYIYTTLFVFVAKKIIIFTIGKRMPTGTNLRSLPSIPTVHNFMGNWHAHIKKWRLFLYG